jgi:hypothetical protein
MNDMTCDAEEAEGDVSGTGDIMSARCDGAECNADWWAAGYSQSLSGYTRRKERRSVEQASEKIGSSGRRRETRQGERMGESSTKRAKPKFGDSSPVLQSASLRQYLVPCGG